MTLDEIIRKIPMTLKEAIQRLKDLRDYARSEIAVYDTMRDDDENVWIKDVKALDIAIETLEGMKRQDTECDFCRARTLENPGSHDFRMMSSSLYYHDSQFGWEGMNAAYCPKCGRKLYARKEDKL